VRVDELRQRFGRLTEREREVMALVVAGRANKRIAADLGRSEVTVKVHRGQMMRKMRARSLPERVRMADRLAPPGVPPQTDRAAAGRELGAPAVGRRTA